MESILKSRVVEGLLGVVSIYFINISIANIEDPDPRMQCLLLVYTVFMSHKKGLIQAFRFMVGAGHCPMISKYGPSLSKAVGLVDPSFLVVKKSHFNRKIVILQRVYELHKTESMCR